MDFIAGRIGGEEEKQLASSIAHVIIAGNSVGVSTSESNTSSISTKTDKAAKIQSEIVAPMKQFDCVLAQTLGSCSIDIMPGNSDPANHLLPQQPLHPCLFTHCSRFNTLKLVTNPYDVVLDNKLFLGHAGQAVQDIDRQVTYPNAMDTDDDASNREIKILESTLKWGHLCPTAPDTLPCYPYKVPLHIPLSHSLTYLLTFIRILIRLSSIQVVYHTFFMLEIQKNLPQKMLQLVIIHAELYVYHRSS